MFFLTVDQASSNSGLLHEAGNYRGFMTTCPTSQPQELSSPQWLKNQFHQLTRQENSAGEPCWDLHAAKPWASLLQAWPRHMMLAPPLHFSSHCSHTRTPPPSSHLLKDQLPGTGTMCHLANIPDHLTFLLPALQELKKYLTQGWGQGRHFVLLRHLQHSGDIFLVSLLRLHLVV